MGGTARVIQLDDIEGIACPCGWARRAFSELPDAPASVHLVDVRADAEPHHHDAHTEVYIVLECDVGGAVELDGERHPVKPMTAVMIGPGVRHRALGRMKILNLVIPPFDPSDEHLD
ncbi:MAG TPA: cupin domain-containing protein [Planctomycetota bacterium]|nr:cupin domain-containing protein [Planctomycetota bacterium]